MDPVMDFRKSMTGRTYLGRQLCRAWRRKSYEATEGSLWKPIDDWGMTGVVVSELWAKTKGYLLNFVHENQQIATVKCHPDPRCWTCPEA